MTRGEYLLFAHVFAAMLANEGHVEAETEEEKYAIIATRAVKAMEAGVAALNGTVTEERAIEVTQDGHECRRRKAPE